jgi:branched-chain amino acid aminotransferase
MPDFKPTRWVWRNGEFIPWESATLHVISHVVHYGSSVFEGIRCYETSEGPRVFRLDDHIRRLHDSCKIYRMPLEYDVPTLVDASCELLARNDLAEGYLRPIVIRGEGAIGVHPGAARVDAYLMCWPWGAYLGDEALQRGVDACVSSWARPAPNTHPMLAKCGGNYPNAQLMKMEAVENGYHEAIGLGTDGAVSEGPGQNIFLVENGTLHTPPLDCAILPGITRDCVLTLAKELSVPVREERIPRERLYIADELFFAGTATEITPVRSVDRIEVGDGKPGRVTRALQRRYLDLARGRAPDIYGWRTAVRQVARVHVS